VLQKQYNEVGQNLQGEEPTAAFTRHRKIECSELHWKRNIRKNLLIYGKEYKHAADKVVLEIRERPACNCTGKWFGNVKVEERKNLKAGSYSLLHHRGCILPVV
jgi:hypothetical protein